jgi:hypothetical protein
MGQEDSKQQFGNILLTATDPTPSGEVHTKTLIYALVSFLKQCALTKKAYKNIPLRKKGLK